MPQKQLLAYLEQAKKQKHKTKNIKIKIFFGCPFGDLRQLLRTVAPNQRICCCCSCSCCYRRDVVCSSSPSSNPQSSMVLVFSIRFQAVFRFRFRFQQQQRQQQRTTTMKQFYIFAQKINKILPTTVFGYASPKISV